jgi:hypothetical protein
VEITIFIGTDNPQAYAKLIRFMRTALRRHRVTSLIPKRVRTARWPKVSLQKAFRKLIRESFEVVATETWRKCWVCLEGETEH